MATSPSSLEQCLESPPKRIPRKKRIEERTERIKGALERGVVSLEELCGIFKEGSKPEGFRKFCQVNDITLPENLIPYRHKPKMDKAIDQFLSLEEIGATEGRTRARAKQYLDSSGRYETWKEGRNKIIKVETNRKESNRQAKKEEIRERFEFLDARLFQLASQEEESWAYEKSIKYRRSKKGLSRSLEEFVPLFVRYEEAQRNGVKLSLEQLGEGLGFRSVHVGQILSDVGLEPLYGKIIRHITPDWKKEAVRRSFKLNFSPPDIEYFLNLGLNLAQFYLSKMGTREIKKPIIRIPLKFRREGETRILSYRLASQIYEAETHPLLGFNREEIGELLDTNDWTVNYVLSHKKSIVPRIIRGLRIMFDDSSIDQPYLDKIPKK